MAGRYDIVIVGAGIVGAACALELAAAGLAVAVVEREAVGAGATAAGMGHIVVMDENQAELRLTRYSQLLWQTLVADDPTYYEYLACGTIWVAADADELAAVATKQAAYQAHAIQSHILDEQTLYELEPNLRPGLAGGLFVPGDCVVYPPRAAARLIERACAAGAELLIGQAVEILPDGLRLADGARVQGERVLLAGGYHSIELAPDLPLRAKKGHLVITDRYPGLLKHQLVELSYIKSAHASSGDSVAFNIQPRSSGQLLIGSSRQYDQHDATVDYGILARMLARAQEYVPVLDQLSVLRVWTGVRAATPDGLPLIGPHPERRGLWLATGHEGLGITTALGTARLLAAQMLGQPPEIPLEAYLPARALMGAAYG